MLVSRNPVTPIHERERVTCNSLIMARIDVHLQICEKIEDLPAFRHRHKSTVAWIILILITVESDVMYYAFV